MYFVFFDSVATLNTGPILVSWYFFYKSIFIPVVEKWKFSEYDIYLSDALNNAIIITQD